jgi:hypothetical protein
MYPKGYTGNLRIKNITPKLDNQSNHKTFSRNNVLMFVYVIEFDNGYVAEYVLPVTEQNPFVPGQYATFKVVDVPTTFAPTVEIISVTDQEAKPAPQTTVLSSSGMAGHPAVYAMGYAVTMSEKQDWDFEDTVKHADKILEWLKINK